MKARIINLKTLKGKKYDELDLGDYYNELLGKIESKTSIFAYGTSGSGKSVFLLKLSNHFADNVGKTLYCSHEEALKKSFRDRSVNFAIDSPRLFIGEFIDFDTLLAKIKSNYYRMFVIDSVQYMSFTYKQLQELNETFRKRKIIPVLVSFGKTYKNPACELAIMHACDIKMYFDKGTVTIDSRYLDSTKKHRLFTPGQTSGQTSLPF